MRSKISAQVAKTVVVARRTLISARSRSTTVLELGGLAGIGVCTGALAGPWWGGLTGSVLAVVYANALGGHPPAGDS